MYKQTIKLILPHHTNQQTTTTQIINKKKLQPNNLIYFNTIHHNFNHINIYINNNKFIHSPHNNSKIQIKNINLTY
ncbi:NlpC/P60 family protein [Pandoraea pneumonica]|uniref:NlpC/P60 family protein n=1 Tax=Pandoraea pneumonica TaxID=2508299 RepID=UPI003CF0FA1C